MTDFFREVDEEVRRDNALKFLQKFKIPLIATAVLIVAGTASWRIYGTWRINQAETAGAAYEAAEQLARDGKSAQAEAAFQAIVDHGPQGYALLARFRAAATTAAGDPALAVKDYDALAADTTIAQVLQDVARFRAALLRLDAADPKEMDERLAPLTRVADPFRNSARELLALSALKADDFTAAGNWLDMIVADSQCLRCSTPACRIAPRRRCGPSDGPKIDWRRTCPFRLPSSAAPMSASRHCSTGSSAGNWRSSTMRPASRVTAARATRSWAILTSR